MRSKQLAAWFTWLRMSDVACKDGLHKFASSGRKQMFTKLVWKMYQNYLRRHIEYSSKVKSKVHISMPTFPQFMTTLICHGYVLGSESFTIGQLFDNVCAMYGYPHLPADVLTNVSLLVGWDTAWIAVLFCPALSRDVVWASNEFLTTKCDWHIGATNPRLRCFMETWWKPDSHRLTRFHAILYYRC